MSHDPETSTPGLDAFLSGGKLRRMTPVEVHEFVRDLFGTMRGLAAAELHPDYHRYRVMALWRVARAMAMTLGLCSADEMLEEAVEPLYPNPWSNPHRPMSAAPDAIAGVPMRAAACRKVWNLANNTEGLSLLPLRGARPEALAAREDWTKAAGHISQALGLIATDIGRAGIAGMLEDDGAARCDVVSGDILAFEDLMVQETQDLYLDKGERLTLRHLNEEFDIMRKEGVALLRLAKAQALKQTQGSVEEKRALQERRLENFLARSKETLDMQGEMVAIKELSKVQGLTRVDPENMAVEFMDTVARVASVQDKEKMDAATLALIDGRAESPKTIEAYVAPTEPTDPDDAAALAEYDRENRS